ncbi:hypothetical protein KC722_02575, partial [Candidatus Kaiserbacteria bacterium]|nr:hypothetical protein [Candidatus Kaiserbacteria bacterium]
MHTHHKEVLDQVGRRKQHFLSQLVYFLVVVLAWGGVWLIDFVNPSFFQYHYLNQAPVSEALVHFWPLLVYFLVLVVAPNITDWTQPHSPADEQAYMWGLITGNFAAVWEELGFRYVFICYSMISIAVVNWLLGTFLLWVMFAMCVVTALLLMFVPERRLFSVVPTLAAAGLWWASGAVDPLYFLYQEIWMPVLNLVSFGSYSEIMYSGQYQM